MNLSRGKKILIVLLILLLVVASSAFAYFNDYYHADESVNKYLESSNSVTVVNEDYGYLFKSNEETDTAVIFYQGAKVEYIAYAPLMYHLAENNIDCFLIDMPLNFPIFDIDKANVIIESYDYTNYYLAGHSMGGSMATIYAVDNADKVKGIILLASYPDRTVDNKLKLLSIYGSNDGVLNRKSYDENKQYWPNQSDELLIEGANHAGFGYYGVQSGDNNASISHEKQQNITINKILEFINE